MISFAGGLKPRLHSAFKIKAFGYLNAALQPTPPVESDSKFPHGLTNAFAFAGFNALSFQVILSSPMILYAKSLGASATILGIIAGMMPLLVIFQIPAASYMSQIGYKRFVFAGWGIRVLFIFGMALVPLTGSFLPPGSQVALMLMLLFGFNLSRGISSCAWLPWITSLVPASIRGRYLVKEAAYVNFCSGITFLFSAFCLGSTPRPWQFALLFLYSAVAGALSLIFLKRIPDADIPESVRNSKTPVPWKAMATYPPFAKLLWMNLAWAIASGGLTTFTVAYLKTMAGLPEATILFLSSVTFLGGLGSLWFVGTRLDRLGSKPLLIFSCALWMLMICGWMALAAKMIPAKIGLLLFLQFGMGLGSALTGMANTRLAMQVVPAMGRNHFFALFSVIQNVALGIAPIGWGLFIDAFRKTTIVWPSFELNRYSLFFGSVLLCFVGMLIFVGRLEEKEAKRFEDLLKDILIDSPQRILVRIWPR